MDISVDVEARLLGGEPGHRVVHVDCPDRPTFAALADDAEGYQFGIPRSDSLQICLDLVERVVVIEGDQSGALPSQRRG